MVRYERCTVVLHGGFLLSVNRVTLVLLVLLVLLRWHAHLHLRIPHLNLRRYHLRRQPVELRVVHWGYRANPLPGVPARHAMHAAEGEMAAPHLLLLLPHGHLLRLQRVIQGCLVKGL